MTLQELRQRWQEVKTRPRDDGERQRIEAELFYQFHLAVQRQERSGEKVFNSNIDLSETKQQGRDMKRR